MDGFAHHYLTFGSTEYLILSQKNLNQSFWHKFTYFPVMRKEKKEKQGREVKTLAAFKEQRTTLLWDQSLSVCGWKPQAAHDGSNMFLLTCYRINIHKHFFSLCSEWIVEHEPFDLHPRVAVSPTSPLLEIQIANAPPHFPSVQNFFLLVTGFHITTWKRTKKVVALFQEVLCHGNLLDSINSL